MSALINTRSVRFLVHRRGRQAAAFGLAFAFGKAAAVVGAVEKWESRAFGEISRGVGEPGETGFWFSPAPMLPSFPRRCFVSLASGSAGRLYRPTTCGPKRIET